MINYILVGLGGIFGSCLRYKLGEIISKRTKKTFNLATFIINISGAFLLGVVYNIKMPDNVYIFIANGFLASYTTFSTFMYEGFQLFKNNKKVNALVYILGTIIIGLISFRLGVSIWTEKEELCIIIPRIMTKPTLRR